MCPPRGRYGRGTRHFPALLTKNLGVDKLIVDMMRPLFNAGVRPERFAKFLLELHTKEHHHACLAHEHEISARRVANADCDAAPLSDFADKARYAGLVPSGKYLSAVYKEYSQSIKPHLNAEVKKRGARRYLDAASLSPHLSPHLCLACAATQSLAPAPMSMAGCTGTCRTRSPSTCASTTARHCTRASSPRPTRSAR